MVLVGPVPVYQWQWVLASGFKSTRDYCELQISSRSHSLRFQRGTAMRQSPLYLHGPPQCAAVAWAAAAAKTQPKADLSPQRCAARPSRAAWETPPAGPRRASG